MIKIALIQDPAKEAAYMGIRGVYYRPQETPQWEAGEMTF